VVNREKFVLEGFMSHTSALFQWKGKTMRRIAVSFFITTFLIGALSLPGICQEAAPDTALQHKLTADGLLREGKTAEAIAKYHEALALDPSFKPLYFNLAVAYHMQKDFKQAIQALEKLTALDPQDGEAQYNLGVLYLYERDLDRAKLHLEKAKLCCDSDLTFKPLVEQSSTFITQVEKLDPMARELVLLLMRRDLGV